MSESSKPQRPTEAELEILSVLWRRGPSTVRDVHDDLASTRGTTYTTVLKLMQIMTAKGLVAREESQRAHVYRACHPQQETRKRLLDDLVNRAFGGSVLGLVQQALEGSKASPEELEEIRRLIERSQGEGK